MNPLPVYDIIVDSYKFLVRELGTIVRLTWLPLLIVAVIRYAIASHALGAMTADIDAGASVSQFASSYWGMTVWHAAVDLVGITLVAVSIHQLILFGDRKPGRYVPVPVGRLELMFVAVTLLLSGSSYLLVSLLLVGEEGFSSFAWGVAVLGLGLTLYFSIRLWPIFPIMVVEGRFDLAKAFRLTKGRFWPLVGLTLLGGIPIMILMLIGIHLWPSFDGVVDLTLSEDPLRRAEDARALIQRAEDSLIARAAFDFVFSMTEAAVGVALISYCYKALTGHSPGQTLLPSNAQSV